MQQDTPTTVRRAVYLLWASLIIGLITSAPEFLTAFPEDSAVVTWMLLAFSFGVPALFIYLISRRHNWARIVTLLLTVGGIAFFLGWPLDGEPEPLWSTALTVVVTAMDLAAIYLLFTRPSSQWFERRGESAF